MSPNSLYRFSEVEAQNPTSPTISNAIKHVLRAKDSNGVKDACYIEMEPYLLPPGVTGSKFFDQANAVRVLLDHDRDGDAVLTKMMAETPSLKQRQLWDYLQRVLRQAGFKMKHGRLAGLIEGPTKKDDDDGQPDID